MCTMSNTGGFDENIYKIYPNPTFDFLTIEGPTEMSEIKIQNIYGVSIIRTKGEVKNIDMSPLPSGIYFITINNKNGKVFTDRIIKL